MSPSDGQRNYRVIALVVAFALFMQQLDATVLTIALPAMSRDLGVAASGLSVALTSYLVALAVFIPASGWLADQFGSRTIFCAAMAVFMMGSIGCAQSDSLPMLVLARFVQGMGGAMMVPVGRLVLLRSVPRENLVLFQINFGLSAATSGTMMMASAVGALAMKPIAPRVIDRFGYRNSLTIASIAAALAVASCALFRVDWPPAALVTVLFLSGFFTSFLFTGYNAIAFVDMDQDRMSAATSLYATFQQLSLSLGICFAASILELSAPMTARSFSIAFVIIGVVAIGATLVNHAIPRDAGK